MAQSSPSIAPRRSTPSPPSFFQRVATARDRLDILDRAYTRDGHGRFSHTGGTVRKSLEDAPTVEAVSAAFSSEATTLQGHQVTANFAGLPATIAREYGEGLLRGIEQFPGTRLSKVGTYGPGGSETHDHAPGALAVTEHGKYRANDDAIYFNTRQPAKEGDYRSELTYQSSGEDRYLVGQYPMHIAIHEYGHVVAGADHGEALASRAVGQRAAEISRYAATNPRELSAEAFADVMVHDHPREASQDAFDAIEGEYDKYGAGRTGLRQDMNNQAAPVPLDRTYKRDADGRFGSGSGLGAHGPVRAELKKAKTTDELNDALASGIERITGRRIPVEMAGSDMAVGRQHAEGILRALERFPDAPLAEVRVVGPRSGSKVGEDRTEREAQDSWDWLSMGGAMAATTEHLDGARHGQRILINRDYASNPAKYDAALKGSGDPKSFRWGQAGHLVAASPTGVAIHEMGHVVARAGRSATAGKRAAAAEAKRQGVKVSELVRSEVSHYAASSIHELAGEAFADVMVHGSDASPTSKAVFAEVASRAPGRGDVTAVAIVPAFQALVREARERHAVEARVFKRDKDGQFSSGGDGGARGIRDALAAPKTIGELETAAAGEFQRILGQRVGVKLQGLDLEAARAHCEGIARGAEMFPHTDLISVTSYGPGGHRADLGNPNLDTAWGVSESRPGRRGADIALNTRITADKMRDVTRRATEGGLVHGDPHDITRTGSHEFTHAAAASLRRGEAEGMAVQKLRQHGGADPYGHLFGAISRYAGSNPDELLGEAGAQVATRGQHASPLARDIIATMQGHWEEWEL